MNPPNGDLIGNGMIRTVATDMHPSTDMDPLRGLAENDIRNDLQIWIPYGKMGTREICVLATDIHPLTGIGEYEESTLFYRYLSPPGMWEHGRLCFP